MQKMSFLWNVYCGYFNSCLHARSHSCDETLAKTHPLHVNNRDIALLYSNQTALNNISISFLFFVAIVPCVCSGSFNSVSLILAVVRIILVGGEMNMCSPPLFTERIQTHLERQRYTTFFLCRLHRWFMTQFAFFRPTEQQTSKRAKQQ